ncbi:MULTISPECIES: helix-turn-helix domain-containing protein [unclassified Aerococcus]|jgi:transcriptional regulator with XRE-family HTH domain|uniref:helix-turn-helix domain-containing protein n=1 Tax=unclassified Aerococcus TaxID=2618060 RepID=UPI0025C153B7|nr:MULTISPECIES: helix-turn-helix transcriptional regulator [unclassified Aerococcus]
MPEQYTIRQIRDLKGLSQEALAQELGVSVKTVSDWENNKVEIKNLHLYAIAYAFKVNADVIKP